MFTETWIGVVLLGALLTAAGGAGYISGRRQAPELGTTRRRRRLPWYFFGAATVFFLGLALYSIAASLGGAATVIHGLFTAFEAYLCAEYYVAQRPRPRASLLLLPLLIAAMFAAAFHPLNAVFLPIVSTFAALVLIVVLVLHIRTPQASQA